MENFYKRIAILKKRMGEKLIKKSGKNAFSNFKYLELEDFLVLALQEAENLDLMIIINFSELTCYDCKSDLKISCSIPTEQAKANLKGCHDVQNLGAVATYLRRYLWVMFLDICEHDKLDLTINPNEDPVKPVEQKHTAPKPTPTPKPTPAPKPTTPNDEIREKLIKELEKRGKTIEGFTLYLKSQGIDIEDASAVAEAATKIGLF